MGDVLVGVTHPVGTSRRRVPGQPTRTREDLGEIREPATASGSCWGPPAERSAPGVLLPQQCVKIPRSSTPGESRSGRRGHRRDRLLERQPYASIGPGPALPRHPRATRCAQSTHSHVRCPGASVSVRHAHAVHPTRVRRLPHRHGGAICSTQPFAVLSSGGLRTFPPYSWSTSGMLGG